MESKTTPPDIQIKLIYHIDKEEFEQRLAQTGCAIYDDAEDVQIPGKVAIPWLFDVPHEEMTADLAKSDDEFKKKYGVGKHHVT